MGPAPVLASIRGGPARLSVRAPEPSGHAVAPRRRIIGLALAVLPAACALPRNAALTEWARTATAAVDRPSMMAGEDPRLAAQEALAVYLHALSILGEPERPLPFRAEAYARLVARAGTDPSAAAISRLGTLLEAARAANLPPDARAMSAAPAPLVEDNRLWRLLPAADGAVRDLAGALSAPLRAAPGPARVAYAAVLAAIAEDHAMLAARALHTRQEALARDLRAAEDRLVRRSRLLPPDPLAAARGPAGGAIAAAFGP